MNKILSIIFTQNEISRIIKSDIIACDIIILGELIKSLGNVDEIKGFIGFSDSNIEDLGNLKVVESDFWISSHTVRSELISLNKLEVVGGDLNLRYSNIKDLGALKKVGGKLSLRDTKIKDLGSLEFVGGDLFLPKRIEKEIDLTNLTVKGKIKFWNDIKTRKKIIPKSEMGYIDFQKPVPYWNHKYVYSYSEIREANSEQLRFYKVYKNHFLNGEYIDIKGNHNYSFILFYDLLENYSSNTKKLQTNLKKLAKYYPKTQIYGESVIIEKFEDSCNFEKAWDLISQNDYINVQKIIEYESKLNRELLNGELIVKLGGFSHLTEFGQKNINEIKPFASKQLEKYNLEKGNKFFDLFVKNGKPIKVKKIVKINKKKSFFGFFKKHVVTR